jgi:hypothetical protein
MCHCIKHFAIVAILSTQRRIIAKHFAIVAILSTKRRIVADPGFRLMTLLLWTLGLD